MEKSVFLKVCMLIDLMSYYNFAIHYVSELWIGRMISGILFCPIFRLFDATWWLNGETNIPESLYGDRSHVILQLCHSSCKWIMNRIDDILLFVDFLTCYHIDQNGRQSAILDPIIMKFYTVIDLVTRNNFAIHNVSKFWTGKIIFCFSLICRSNCDIQNGRILLFINLPIRLRHSKWPPIGHFESDNIAPS